jgi:hypothetical protein
MANAEEFRRRRDRALKAWRHEVERFGELEKSSSKEGDRRREKFVRFPE